MDISFTTVVNTLFFSAIAIILLGVMIDRTRMISGKNFRFLFLMIILIMVRLFVPCEILKVQNNVYLTRIYPEVYLFLTKPFFTFWGKGQSVTSILLMISLAGSVFCGGRLFLSYFAISRTLKGCRTVRDERISRLLSVINKELGKTASFRVVQGREITVPFIFGLWRPVIALPEAGLSEEEWYYILSHEMAHYYHRDLWLRSACEILHMVYWWNPFVGLLRSRLIVFQERHIDAEITQKLDEERMLDYLSCLIKMAKLRPAVHEETWVAGFHGRAQLQDRISRLLELQENKEEKPMGGKYCFSHFLGAVLLVLFALFLPTLITLEPNGGVPDEISEECFMLTPENAYLILNEEGKYEVYADGEFKGVTSQILEDTLHIYNREGEVIK